jgi:hypothetical protein
LGAELNSIELEQIGQAKGTATDHNPHIQSSFHEPKQCLQTGATWTKHRNAKRGILTIVAQNEGNVQQR